MLDMNAVSRPTYRLLTAWFGVLALALVLLALPALGARPAAATAGGYRTINLGALPGGDWSNASAVNGSGVVVGVSNGDGHTNSPVATVWRPDGRGGYQAIDLTPDLAPYFFSEASAINDAGLIVGRVNVYGSIHATLWRPTTGGPTSGARTLGPSPVTYQEIRLPELPGDGYSGAFGISAGGIVVGSSSGSGDHPTEWLPNGDTYTAVDLDGKTHPYGDEAEAINPEGVVAGHVGVLAPLLNPPYISHAAIWTPTPGDGTTLTYLDTLPGDGWSDALGIDPAGQVVGYSNGTGTGWGVPVMWRPTEDRVYSVAALPLPTGISYGAASAISPAGTVAGFFAQATDGLPQEAAVWNPSRGGYRVTLLSGQQGFEWSTATGINGAGLVVGNSGTIGYNTNLQLATLWRPLS